MRDDDDDDTRTPQGDPVYREPARSYTSVWLILLVLAAGYALDANLGGAVDHLPGWIIATVLIVGIDVLLVYAARSTRSLVVTTDEIWVGDEMLVRSEIVGAEFGVDRDAPVLGWPTGNPRLLKGITVRLASDEDVVIPTRKPKRLDTELGAAAVGPRSKALVRPAEDVDLSAIPEIDERAEVIFRLAGYDIPQIEFDEDGLADAKAVFVFETPPVGFAWVGELDGLAHLEEIAVLPSAMRKGIGARLLERACEWAADEGYPAITLTTYADVPWNGPYYAARGFAEIDETTPGLSERRAREVELGLDEAGRRIVMRRDLTA